jgi:hypothetical protein
MSVVKAVKVAPAVVRNFYELIGSHYTTPQRQYENYPQFQIDIPCRILICGGTGSGKTNILMNIIFGMACWTRFYLCAKNLSEDLYNFLITEIQKVEKKLKKQGEILFVCSEISELPLENEFDKRYNNLVIIDDFINEPAKVLKPLANLFTMGRKRNISCVFISQGYTETPIMIRKNCSQVILKEMKPNDLRNILRGFSTRYSSKELMAMFDLCHTNEVDQFFLVDLAAKTEALKFRHNWEPIE